MAMYVNGRWTNPTADTYLQWPQRASGSQTAAPQGGYGSPPGSPPRVMPRVPSQGGGSGLTAQGAPRVSGSTPRQPYQPMTNRQNAISTPGSRGGAAAGGNVTRYGDGGSNLQGGGIGSTGGTGAGPLARLPATPGGYAQSPMQDPGRMAGGGGGMARTQHATPTGAFVKGPGGATQTMNPYVHTGYVQPFGGGSVKPYGAGMNDAVALPTKPATLPNLPMVPGVGGTGGGAPAGMHTGPAVNDRIPGGGGYGNPYAASAPNPPPTVGSNLGGVLGGYQPVYNGGQVDQLANRAAEPVLRQLQDQKGALADAASRGGYVNPAHLAALQADAGMQAAGAMGSARRDAALDAAGVNAQHQLAWRGQDIGALQGAREQDIAQRGQDIGYSLNLGQQGLSERGQDISQRGQNIEMLLSVLNNPQTQQYLPQLQQLLAA